MKTKPRHWLDLVFWPTLKLVWEPFSLKKSHWWHWLPYEGVLPNHEYCLTVGGDPKAKKADDFWPNFYERNFGWQKVALLHVYDDKGRLAEDYHLGYSLGAKKEICSLLLSHGVGALLGPEPTTFFAIDQDGLPLQVQLYCYTSRINLKNSVIGKNWSTLI